jgi:UDP-2-acetamido-3-amino-2,3-dideoxy-glucuronate N-acetyltransferase
MSELREDPRFPGARFHASSYIDDGAAIGEGTTIWHFCHVLAGTVVGKKVSVGQNVMAGPNVRIGDGCKIQNNVSLYEGVELEADVFCGPSCVFTNVINPRAAVSRKAEFRKTLVKQGVTLGANSTILCGVTIGEFALIGAGSVVTRDVAPHALMVGSPARRTGWVSRTGEKLGSDLVCPRTGERYRLTRPDHLTLSG